MAGDGGTRAEGLVHCPVQVGSCTSPSCHGPDMDGHGPGPAEADSQTKEHRAGGDLDGLDSSTPTSASLEKGLAAETGHPGPSLRLTSTMAPARMPRKSRYWRCAAPWGTRPWAAGAQGSRPRAPLTGRATHSSVPNQSHNYNNCVPVEMGERNNSAPHVDCDLLESVGTRVRLDTLFVHHQCKESLIMVAIAFSY